MSYTHLICPQTTDTSLPDRLIGSKHKVQKGIKVKIARQNLGRLLLMTPPKPNRSRTGKHDEASEKNTRN